MDGLVGGRGDDVGEEGEELVAVGAGGRVDDDGLAVAGGLDAADAVAVALEALARLGGAEVHEESIGSAGHGSDSGDLIVPAEVRLQPRKSEVRASVR